MSLGATSDFKPLRKPGDLWQHRDLGEQARYTGDLPPHGCVLLRVKAFLGTSPAPR